MTTDDQEGKVRRVSFEKKPDWTETLEPYFCECGDETSWPHFRWLVGVRDGLSISLVECTRCGERYPAGFIS